MVLPSLSTRPWRSNRTRGYPCSPPAQGTQTEETVPRVQRRRRGRLYREGGRFRKRTELSWQKEEGRGWSERYSEAEEVRGAGGRTVAPLDLRSASVPLTMTSFFSLGPDCGSSGIKVAFFFFSSIYQPTVYMSTFTLSFAMSGFSNCFLAYHIPAQI